MVTRQLQVERRTEKVRWSKTNVLPLPWTPYLWGLFMQRCRYRCGRIIQVLGVELDTAQRYLSATDHRREPGRGSLYGVHGLGATAFTHAYRRGCGRTCGTAAAAALIKRPFAVAPYGWSTTDRRRSSDVRRLTTACTASHLQISQTFPLSSILRLLGRRLTFRWPRLKCKLWRRTCTTIAAQLMLTLLSCNLTL